MRLFHAVSVAAFLAGTCATPAFAAAEIEDIRIGQHRSYLRIVLDVSEAVKHRIEPDGTVIIDGVQTGSAVLNAEPSQKPLNRLTVTPEEGSARIEFDTSGPIRVKAFALTPDSFGGNRLVVDLVPQTGQAAQATNETPTKSAPGNDASATVAALPSPPKTPAKRPEPLAPAASAKRRLAGRRPGARNRSKVRDGTARAVPSRRNRDAVSSHTAEPGQSRASAPRHRHRSRARTGRQWSVR